LKEINRTSDWFPSKIHDPCDANGFDFRKAAIGGVIAISRNFSSIMGGDGG
jgi:hypothetical protein